MTIKISGYSDDLITVEGALSEEFQFDETADENYVYVSNAAVFRVTYGGEGVWRFMPVVIPNDGTVTIVQAPEDDEDNYSDVVTIEGDIAWVGYGTALIK